MKASEILLDAYRRLEEEWSSGLTSLESLVKTLRLHRENGVSDKAKSVEAKMFESQAYAFLREACHEEGINSISSLCGDLHKKVFHKIWMQSIWIAFSVEEEQL